VASNPFIINASPLIFLYKINGLEWVCRLADSRIVVPQAVIQEIAAGDGVDSGPTNADRPILRAMPTIAHDQAGAGHPLLLVHAGIVNRHMWDPVTDALSAGYRVIRPDLRGFGELTPEPTDYEVYAWCAVDRAVDDLLLNRLTHADRRWRCGHGCRRRFFATGQAADGSQFSSA
jgi:pimeloyl-ACP methyl ester carboxylesterase